MGISSYDGDQDHTKQELLGWIAAKRRHVLDQVEALPEDEQRRSRVPSGWTPLGAVQHLALDVERVWLRKVMGGEGVELPVGYEGWTVPASRSAADVLKEYTEEARLGAAAVADLPLDAGPVWWFDGAGDPPYSTLLEVLLHVLVETATHAGHLDIARELADGGRRLVLDEPE
jgi:uncharacterized damage-inducible protein DinB